MGRRLHGLSLGKEWGDAPRIPQAVRHKGGKLFAVSSKYPKDQFDDVATDGPVGAHRRPPSPWLPVLPFLLVLLLVPLLAWGAMSLIQGRSGTEVVEVEVPPQSASEQPAQSEGGQSAPAAGEQDQPTADKDDGEALADKEKDAAEKSEKDKKKDKPAEPPVDYQASILVLNGTQIEGYGASKVSQLSAAGFTGAWADNAGAMTAGQNTVYYSSKDFKKTAEEVASVLGLGAPVEAPDVTGGVSVVVLLVN